jgi:hypothetical protein
VGALIGGGAEIISEKLNGESVNWRKVEGSAVKGAITGGAIGLAGPEAGVVTSALVGAGGNVVGGIADRTIQGESAKAVLNPKDMVTDAVSGAVGGAAGGAKVGEKAGEFVATESAKVAAATGDQAAASMFSRNAPAAGTAAAKLIELTQGTVESSHSQTKPQQQAKPAQQQQPAPPQQQKKLEWCPTCH